MDEERGGHHGGQEGWMTFVQRGVSHITCFVWEGVA